jgi:hypothetical protein
MPSRTPILLALVLIVAWVAPATAGDSKEPQPRKSALRERAPKLEIRGGKAAPESGESDARRSAKEAQAEAEKRRQEAEARRRAGRIGTTVPEGPTAGSTSTQRGTPDPRALREQHRSAFPIAPPQQGASPYERTDPSKARREALERARRRAMGNAPEETVEIPDPMGRTLPGRGGLPGGGNDAESLKGLANRLPGSGAGPDPYEGASVAKKRPFFRLQHQGGGQGVWRCVKYCSENGFALGELTDTAGLPDNAVRDDVSDMTTTEKLCEENPKLCEEAGRSDRRPGEDDEEYWDRKAREAYAARKERERRQREETANADCSKKQSQVERESCEFDKKIAQEEIERERKRKAEQEKEKQEDCALAGGEDCDGLPDDELLDWHQAQQRRLLEATGAGRDAGPGNIDPVRDPQWAAGPDGRPIEILGVSDPPEAEGGAVGEPPQGDCKTDPATGAIDYGPDHLEGGKPGCETETPQFDSQETLDLEDASDDDDE